MVVTVVALFCTIAMTWPVALHLGEGVLTTKERTENPDLGQNVWNVWHFVATWNRSDVLWSRVVAAPLAVNMVTQSYGLTNLVVTLPIALLAGPVVAANCIVLLGFWARIVLMTVLVVRVTRALPLAFVVACVFVLTPAHLKNIEWAADENAALQWIVLVHISAVWWLKSPNTRRSVTLALVMTVVSLSSGYFGLFGMVYVGLLTVALLWSQQANTRRVATIAAWFGTVGLLWAGVMAVLSSDMTNPLIRSGVRWESTQFALGGGDGLRDWVMRQTVWLHVVSVADLVTPMANHPLWGLIPAIKSVSYPSEMGGYLGIVCLAVVLWTCVRQREVRLLTLVALVCVVLAGGLELKLWYDQPFAAIPGLFWVLDFVGVFRNASRLGLFLVYAWVPLLLVVSYGLAHIDRRWQQWALCAAMLVDFAPPHWVIVPMHTSSLAAHIPNDGSAGAVLTLPVQKNAQQPLIDQLCHQRPIVAGYLARTPAYPVSWQQFTISRDPQRLLLPLDGVTALQNMGIRYVLAQDQSSRAALDHMVGEGVERTVASPSGAVYAIPDGSVPLIIAGTGWWDEESSAGRVCRWSTGDAELVVLSALPRRIQLVVQASSLAPTVLTWQLDGVPVGSLSIAAQPAQTTRVLSQLVPAGRSILRIHAPTVLDAHGRAVAVAFTQLTYAAHNR